MASERSMEKLVAASEKSMRREVTVAKCEIKVAMVKEVHASGDRILHKLDQLKGIK
ncbi:hypothetical protein L873DRAFT_1820187 [Choiromyces venosus 120613-1]|uniref:Uncharacterized protein n=1 Tax=Choiromyces venosus 120613-1 TaxID=1336337 RepID=A0A3N4J181_9PEZI|nr:hypothetical protein L873DRAFT_1820187 [Choiromyces venosus 120613-1]